MEEKCKLQYVFAQSVPFRVVLVKCLLYQRCKRTLCLVGLKPWMCFSRVPICNQYDEVPFQCSVILSLMCVKYKPGQLGQVSVGVACSHSVFCVAFLQVVFEPQCFRRKSHQKRQFCRWGQGGSGVTAANQEVCAFVLSVKNFPGF